MRTDTAAAGAAIASLVPVALYQLGFLSHLPDPPLAVFASDRLTQSKAAHPFGIPDSLLGLASYTATLVLLVRAPQSRLTGMKLLGDGTVAVAKTVREVARFRKLCSWCLLTVAATGVMIFSARRFVR